MRRSRRLMPSRQSCKSVLAVGRAASNRNGSQAGCTESTDRIHLGVHGIASDQPDRGALVFLPDAPAGEDGLLEVPEIVRLQLRSDLAVLSACDTAVGTVQGQEGVANLSRAFLLAGARSVVSTLWAIDDAFSATLMRSFYSSLAHGMPKAAALVAAQRYIVQRFPDTAVSWFWAGYMLEGERRHASPTCGRDSTRPKEFGNAGSGNGLGSSTVSLGARAQALSL